MYFRFAKNCLKIEKVRNFFPVNKKDTKNTRYNNIYKVNFAKTDSYRNSAIPNLQRLLNEHEQERNRMLKW